MFRWHASYTPCVQALSPPHASYATKRPGTARQINGITISRNIASWSGLKPISISVNPFDGFQSCMNYVHNSSKVTWSCAVWSLACQVQCKSYNLSKAWHDPSGNAVRQNFNRSVLNQRRDHESWVSHLEKKRRTRTAGDVRKHVHHVMTEVERSSSKGHQNSGTLEIDYLDRFPL